MEINNKSKFVKKSMCYYFDSIMKIDDFDFDNVLIDEKS